MLVYVLQEELSKKTRTGGRIGNLEKVVREGFGKRRGEGKGTRTEEVCGSLQVNVNPLLLWRTYADLFRALQLHFS